MLAKVWGSERGPYTFSYSSLPIAFGGSFSSRGLGIEEIAYLCLAIGRDSLPMALAGVAQLVERQLPKLKVAGSKPVSRSRMLVYLHA